MTYRKPSRARCASTTTTVRVNKDRATLKALLEVAQARPFKYTAPVVPSNVDVGFPGSRTPHP